MQIQTSMSPLQTAAVGPARGLEPRPGAPAVAPPVDPTTQDPAPDAYHGLAFEPSELVPDAPAATATEAPAPPAPQAPTRWSASTDGGLLLAEAPGDQPGSLALLEQPAGICADMTPAQAAAVLDIRQTFAEQPAMAEVLESFLADRDHPMNLVSYLMNPESRPVVLEHLHHMAGLPQPDPDQLKDAVATADQADVPLFHTADTEFNTKNGKKGTEALREELLARDPELFSTGAVPAGGQAARLDEHARHLRNTVLPSLHAELDALVADLPSGNGFPAVNARAKTAAGMLDKVQRMRDGNDGKSPRPDYSLADMPDAVGGRITVRSPEDLQTVMHRLEERFGKDAVYEKDNFYSNPVKKMRPYRCITYTVMHEGVPCEIQLTTLNASLTADLWHNTGYKPLHPELPDDSVRWIGGLQRAVTVEEHATLAAST